MIRYLLDTNVWIDLLKRIDVAQSARLGYVGADKVATCSVVWAELLHGALKYDRVEERTSAVTSLLDPYTSLPFDKVAAQRYALTRHDLEVRGEGMATNDLMIAAIALQHGLTLVTHDQAFSRITGLTIEDWRTV